MGTQWEQGKKINPPAPLLYLKMKTSIEGVFKVSNFFFVMCPSKWLILKKNFNFGMHHPTKFNKLELNLSQNHKKLMSFIF
jgi:hypothetical protein